MELCRYCPQIKWTNSNQMLYFYYHRQNKWNQSIQCMGSKWLLVIVFFIIIFILFDHTILNQQLKYHFEKSNKLCIPFYLLILVIFTRLLTSVNNNAHSICSKTMPKLNILLNISFMPMVHAFTFIVFSCEWKTCMSLSKTKILM